MAQFLIENKPTEQTKHRELFCSLTAKFPKPTLKRSVLEVQQQSLFKNTIKSQGKACSGPKHAVAVIKTWYLGRKWVDIITPVKNKQMNQPTNQNKNSENKNGSLSGPCHSTDLCTTIIVHSHFTLPIGVSRRSLKEALVALLNCCADNLSSNSELSYNSGKFWSFFVTFKFSLVFLDWNQPLYSCILESNASHRRKLSLKQITKTLYVRI